MSNIITYLFIGVTFNLVLDLLNGYLESENRLNFKEKVIATLIWPIALIIFTYHFVKGLIR